MEYDCLAGHHATFAVRVIEISDRLGFDRYNPILEWDENPLLDIPELQTNWSIRLICCRTVTGLSRLYLSSAFRMLSNVIGFNR